MNANAEALIQAEFSDNDFNGFLCQEVSSTIKFTDGQVGIIPALTCIHAKGKDGMNGFSINLLADPKFNDFQYRCNMLREIGKKCWENTEQIVAVFLASEAWVRTSSLEERQTREKVEDFEDKQEVALIQGSSIDGRVGCSRVIIQRDANNLIHFDTPKFILIGEIERPLFNDTLLQNFWDSYLAEIMQLED